MRSQLALNTTSLLKQTSIIITRVTASKKCISMHLPLIWLFTF